MVVTWSRRTIVLSALVAAACGGGLDDPGIPCPPGKCVASAPGGTGGGSGSAGTGGAGAGNAPSTGGASGGGGSASSGGSPPSGGTSGTSGSSGGAPPGGGSGGSGGSSGGAPPSGGSGGSSGSSGGAPPSGGSGGSSGSGSFGNTACPSFPSPSGSNVPLSSTREISGTFDGENQRFIGTGDLGTSGSSEGQDPLFNLSSGATLRNVIIGAPAADGIHCEGSCTLENVWFEDVGEDAITARGSSSSTTVTIQCGGARQADDKIVQHNGGGTVIIRNFTADTFGKLYRSCGNCGSQYARHVVLENITARNGDTLAGVNENYDDTATFRNILVGGGTNICEVYRGNNSGAEPSSLGYRMDGVTCIYTSSDIHFQ